jgi:hypothetical protein
MEQCTPDHPTAILLFAVEGQPTEQQAAAVRKWAARLPRIRTWSVPIPELVDEFDEASTHTLGVFTRLYSAHHPWQQRIPLPVDRSQFEDVCGLVEAAQALSLAIDDDLLVEYDGEAIGWVRRGVATDDITTRLLGEWRLGLEAKTREILLE